jgi:hypothetical protein
MRKLSSVHMCTASIVEMDSQFIPISEHIKLGTLNIYSFLYVDNTSIK